MEVAPRNHVLLDSYISHTADDIAIVMAHNRSVCNADIHKLALDAFVVGTQSAKDLVYTARTKISLRTPSADVFA